VMESELSAAGRAGGVSVLQPRLRGKTLARGTESMWARKLHRYLGMHLMLAVRQGLTAVDALMRVCARDVGLERSEALILGLVHARPRRSASEIAVMTGTIPHLLRLPGQYYEGGGGRAHEDSSRLHYNGHRTYDSSSGRFLQSEPLLQSPGFVQGMAQQGMTTPTYAYAHNNPLKYTDPTGLRNAGRIGAWLRRPLLIKGYVDRSNSPNERLIPPVPCPLLGRLGSRRRVGSRWRRSCSVSRRWRRWPE